MRLGPYGIRMTQTPNDARWEIRRGNGPVLATAVHAGHALRDELHAHVALDDAARRREEDPLTDVLASVGDGAFTSRASRFEIDLNRPPEEAVYRVPDDAWGLGVWQDGLPDELVERSMESHARYYALMGEWLESLIAAHGRVLLLDVHSYNHRRDGAEHPSLPQADNPDIDLGLTTADYSRFAGVVDGLAETLRRTRFRGGAPDVRANVRFPDGGHWPEWVHATYGEHVCTVTLEYKKTFMDEWSGIADLAAVEELRAGLVQAVGVARRAL